jgi:quinol monooxygenase YgiN
MRNRLKQPRPSHAGREVGLALLRVDRDLSRDDDHRCAPLRVVERARRAAGCLNFAITADLLDPGRVNIFGRWESQAAVEAFRRGGPSNKQGAAMLSASAAEYDIANVRPLFGKGRA